MAKSKILSSIRKTIAPKKQKTQKEYFSRAKSGEYSLDYDNLINKINKRMQRLVKQVGTQSIDYTNMLAAAIQRGLDVKYNKKQGIYQIQRNKKNKSAAFEQDLIYLSDSNNFSTVGELKSELYSRIPNVEDRTVETLIKNVRAAYSFKDNISEAMVYIYNAADSEEALAVVARMYNNGAFDNYDDITAEEAKDMLDNNISTAFAHRQNFKQIRNSDVRNQYISSRNKYFRQSLIGAGVAKPKTLKDIPAGKTIKVKRR